MAVYNISCVENIVKQNVEIVMFVKLIVYYTVFFSTTKSKNSTRYTYLTPNESLSHSFVLCFVNSRYKSIKASIINTKNIQTYSYIPKLLFIVNVEKKVEPSDVEKTEIKILIIILSIQVDCHEGKTCVHKNWKMVQGNTYQKLRFITPIVKNLICIFYNTEIYLLNYRRVTIILLTDHPVYPLSPEKTRRNLFDLSFNKRHNISIRMSRCSGGEIQCY
ncbi:hypothetical protein AGLY_002786, partial [Aphis glycines]